MGIELRTARLVLREFRESDAAAIAGYASDPDYRQFLGPGHPEPPQFVANNLALDPAREASWVIQLDGAIVGSVFLGIDTSDGSGELACLVAPAYWRRGIAFEATAAVIAYAFGARGLLKLFARAESRNAGSIATMEKLGMRREAVLQDQNPGLTGERRDVVVYGLLAGEWESATWPREPEEPTAKMSSGAIWDGSERPRPGQKLPMRLLLSTMTQP